jgi:hypothetical protein
MNKICLIIAAVFFGIGAVGIPNVQVNWTNAGLCMVAVAAVLGH